MQIFCQLQRPCRSHFISQNASPIFFIISPGCRQLPKPEFTLDPAHMQNFSQFQQVKIKLIFPKNKTIGAYRTKNGNLLKLIFIYNSKLKLILINRRNDNYMTKEQMEKISIRVSTTDLALLRGIAERQGLDLSKVIRSAIKDYLVKEVNN